ncbi:MAG: sigma-54-dependent Fis family transcriptional regulator, partial [Prevotella sp.]|nr:sigma-54-dependent Fis family transcriptional regulator [Prevotella sp.]
QHLAEDMAQDYNVNSLLTHAMDDVIALVNADKGFLLLIRDGRIHSHVSRNFYQESIDDNLFSDSIVQHVLETKQPLIVRDALSDETFNTSQSVINMKFCSVMCMPLMDRGALIGIIYVGNDNIVNQFKPQHLEALRIFASQISLILANAILVDDLTFENRSLTSKLDELRFGNIIGECLPMREVFNTVHRVAATEVTVLIEGETGTGKELIAQELHRQSARAKGPFVVINCGAIPEGTIDSELFGHEKGSYTDAIGETEGYFGAANKGTLFLDEVGELPLATQARLLRVLETGEYIRVGGQEIRKTDVRIVAATNVNIRRAISEGRFREDLYYRLNTIPIQMPPLRDRGEDIVLLFRLFAMQMSEKYHLPRIQLTDSAKQVLMKYKWPGNVRQLKNITEQMSVLSTRREIDASDMLKFVPMHEESTELATIQPHNGGSRTYENEREMLFKILYEMRGNVSDLRREINSLRKQIDEGQIHTDTLQVRTDNLPIQTYPAASVQPIDYAQEISEPEDLNVNALNRKALEMALGRCGGNRKKAAQMLGISDRNLYRRLKQFGLS